MDIESSRIAVAVFDDKKTFVNSCLRPSEFRESPLFALKKFTIEEYAASGEVPNYEDVIIGCNLAREEISSFLAFYKADASPLEHRLGEIDAGYVVAVNYEICDRSEFYVVLKHEFSHALYHVDPEYKKIADDMFNSIPAEEKELVRTSLSDDGYSEDHMATEFAAYLLDGSAFRDMKKRLALFQPLEKYYHSRIKSRMIRRIVMDRRRKDAEIRGNHDCRIGDRSGLGEGSPGHSS